METINEIFRQNWMFILIGVVVVVGIGFLFFYRRGSASGSGSIKPKMQEVYMIMPEGILLPLQLSLDYASSYSNVHLEVGDIRRSWLVLPKFQRRVRDTKRNKIFLDYRSLVPIAPGEPKEERKEDISWANKILTQIGSVQFDVTSFLAPKIEIKNRLRDSLVTIGLIGAIGVVIIAILFITLK